MSILRGVISSYSLFGPYGVALVAKARLLRRSIKVSVANPGLKYPVHIRLRATDVSLLSEVLVDAEYDWDFPVPPRVIVDAGANIGLTSVFYANKYPDARILAIEPELSNFELLKENAAPYSNIVCLQAALWKYDTNVTITDPGFGHWGFQTTEEAMPSKTVRQIETEGIAVTSLMERFGINYIDFLRVDIEGAEKEVFESASSWIHRVGVIAIELHDRLKTGCSRSLYLATKDFQWVYTRGETVFLGRGEQPGTLAASQSPSTRRLSARRPCTIVSAI
jgi:FkbM family methyltransferase